MNLKEMRAAALKAAQDIIKAAKDAQRDLTAEEGAEVEAKFAEIEELDKKIEAAGKSDDLMSRIAGMSGLAKSDETPARSIGEHFAQSLKATGRSLKEPGTFVAPQFKASSDVQSVGSSGGAFGPLVTDVDRSFVLPYQRPLVIADLMGSGTVSGNAITYPVFGALEGATAFVSEGGQKPQVHVADPTWVTDALGEVAGFFKLTDDMAEDIPYVVSEIEGTARYDLLGREEAALLSGNGTSPNLRGILNRSGIQTITQGVGESVADAIFRAITAVQTASGFVADGIVMNPTDYQGLRIAKDGNNQYYGGGYFAGQYGNGGITMQPPVWGLNTVVTSATTAKTVVVAAWKTAKVFRKGGLRVESTNSHADDFTNDKITVRLRERLGLQVKYPAAFVKVTLL